MRTTATRLSHDKAPQPPPHDDVALRSCCGGVPSFHLVKGEVASGVYSGETAPQTVTGLVSNRVAAISVRVGDRLEPVTVARNTFFWQAPTSDVTRGDIKGLVVRWHDGHRFDVNLDFGDA